MITPPNSNVKSSRSKVVLAILFLIFQLQAIAQNDEVAMSRLIIKENLSSPQSLSSLLEQRNLSCSVEIPQIGVVCIQVPSVKVESLLIDLSKEDSVVYVEEDSLSGGDDNDPYFYNGALWHLDKVNATQAWNVTQGSNDIMVAVLDTGVDYTHPDLAENVLSVGGYDFVNNDIDPMDDHGHGTGVAGCVAPVTGNAIGIAGVARNTKILPVKVMNANNRAYTVHVAQGIIHAADSGAQIINLSYSTGNYSHAIADAVEYAWNKNCVLICSAGNEGDTQERYPASLENVISVASTTFVDQRSFFSSYGNSIDLCAPGSGIISLNKGGLYRGWSGTSFSAPLVAGVASLIAASPQVNTNQEIIDILLSSTDDLGDKGFDESFGHGRLNAQAAVNMAFSPVESNISGAAVATVKSTPPTLALVELAEVTLTVDVDVALGAGFIVECSEDMKTWHTAYSGVGTGASSRITIASASANCGFYRVNLN